MAKNIILLDFEAILSIFDSRQAFHLLWPALCSFSRLWSFSVEASLSFIYHFTRFLPPLRLYSIFEWFSVDVDVR